MPPLLLHGFDMAAWYAYYAVKGGIGNIGAAACGRLYIALGQ
jgi:hypothetical protein